MPSIVSNALVFSKFNSPYSPIFLVSILKISLRAQAKAYFLKPVACVSILIVPSNFRARMVNFHSPVALHRIISVRSHFCWALGSAARFMIYGRSALSIINTSTHEGMMKLYHVSNSILCEYSCPAAALQALFD